MKTKQWAVALGMMLALGACGGDDDDDTGSDGGKTADSGMQMTCTPAQKTMCEAAYPSCFTNLFTMCTPSGACTAGPTMTIGMPIPTGVVQPICWANGVKHRSEATLDPYGPIDTTTYKPAGGVCYHYVSQVAMATNDVTLKYYNMKGGTLIATQVVRGNGTTTFQCAGMAEVTLPAGCGGSAGTGSGGGGCTQGACTAP